MSQPTFEIETTDLTHDARAVGHIDGKTVFIAGALPSERIIAQRTRTHRQFDEAKLIQVLTASEHRVEPLCPHFNICSGCVLQHLAAPQQILAKQRTLLENLERIGHIQPQTILPPLTAASWGYRRRGRLSVKWVTKKNSALVGFREINGRYVADMTTCLVAHPAIGQRIHVLRELIAQMDAKCDIPQIEFSVSDDTAALIIRHLSVLSSNDVEKLVSFVQHENENKALLPLTVYLQPGGLDSVHLLTPTSANLQFNIPNGNINLKFQPLDFIQINGLINQKMISLALQLLDPSSEDSILDLFCGLGNFTLPLARVAKSVTGVEGEAGLVARAQQNAEYNNIQNTTFFTANLFEDQSKANWFKQNYDLMLLDPPRAGAQEILQQITLKSVKRLLYVSCHPASLARDAQILVEKHGFQLQQAGVMDMFPHTAHVESIALFVK